VHNIVGVRPDDQQVFAELGMTSLMAIQLANRLAANLGTRLPATTVLEHPTIARLTDYLAETIWNGHKGEMTAPLPTIDLKPVARDREIPLSLAQQQGWLRYQSHPDDPAGNLSVYVRLTGKLDVATLKASLDEMMRRHEILRTTFAVVNDSPAQVIAPASAVNLSRVDLRNLPEQEQSNEVERLARPDAQRAFDLTKGPLWRVTLMQLGEESFVLGFVLHHSIIDVASVEIFFKELGILYDAFLGGKPSPLPALPIQYADFAYWQQQSLTPAVLDERRNYWRQWLAEEPPPLKLAIDQPRPPVETWQVGSEWRQFSPDLTRSIATLSQRSGATPFVTLLASLATLLSRYGGGKEIVVGIPFAGRNHHLLESSIGVFATGTFPLCVDLSGNPSFRELVNRVQRAYLSALANGDVPLEPLVRTLSPERNLRQNPLCRVLLNLLPDIPGANLRLAGVTATRLQPEDTIRRDIILNVWEERNSAGTALHLWWRYKRDLFEPDTIAKMADDFQTLVEQIVANPEQSVDEFPIFANGGKR
jgi:acyl carrier protein